MQARNLPVAIVANKVRRSMPRYQPLDWFLESLELKLTARLIDSDVYLRAVEAGFGIFEMSPSVAAAECQQFLPLAEWVEAQESGRAPLPDGNVYELARSAQR
jgi:chromosome partitioning protein